MKCITCGFESPPEMRYCGMCGTRLATVCANCGFSNPPSYHFCGMCGAPLPGEAEPYSQLPLPLSTPEAVIPLEPVPIAPALPEQAEQASLLLEGERRLVTAVLADVKGSTNLIEQIGNESWVEVMNRMLRILEVEVYRFGGIVAQFRGDGMLAFFGTTSAHEDDPERAVLAGLAMQQAIKAYAAVLNRDAGIDLSVRVGINTGEVILTSVGDAHTYKEDTAMGEAITVASRMETSAEPGTVLVSENTYRLVESSFYWQPLGAMEIKGYSQPMPVYRPLKPLTDPEHALEQAPAAGFTPPTGRTHEFETLQHSVQNLQGGRGGIAIISGEKGMGKSFLVANVRQYFVHLGQAVTSWAGSDQAASPTDKKESLPGSNPLAEAAAGENPPLITWLRGHCRSYEQSWPYMVWIDILFNWLGLHPDAARDAMAARLRQQSEVLWGKDFEKFYPYLAKLLSLPLEEEFSERVKHLNAVGLQKQFFLTVRNWVQALSHRGPLVLSFSDLHWADITSLDLLKYCLTLCDSQPLLWLFVFRPERSCPVWEFHHHVETEFPHRLIHIDLPALTNRESLSLVDELTSPGALSAGTRDLIVQKSEGNPYFIQEMVRTLVARGALVQDSETGAWREVGQLTSLDLPDSLQNLLLARIDRLSADERRTLQMAAVIGPAFWRNLLEYALAGQVNLTDSLTGLQRAQLIQERSQVQGLGMEYLFTSSLVRDVAYDSLLSQQRTAAHLKVAEHLEECVDLDCRVQYEGMIAYHYRNAGNKNKELLYTLKAAEKARSLYANAEALEYYTRCLELLEELENSSKDENIIYAIRCNRFEVLNHRSQVYIQLGNISAGEADARALLPLARHIDDDPAWLIDALLNQPEINNPQTQDDLEIGLQMANEALALSRQIKDQRREMLSLIQIGGVYVLRRDPRWHEIGDQALALARQIGDIWMEVNLLLMIGSSYGMDDLQRNDAYLEAAMAICKKENDKRTELNLLSAIAPHYERAGDYYTCLVDYQQKKLAISREIGDRMSEADSLMYCSQIQGLYLGDLEAALPLAEEAARIWEDLGAMVFPLLRVAQTHIALGNFGKAQAILEKIGPSVESYVHELGRAGFNLVSAIYHNAYGGEASLRAALEFGARTLQMANENRVSRQYQMGALCEMSAAHLGLVACLGDQPSSVDECQMHCRQALDCSTGALEIFKQFGFTQIIECFSEEILFRHARALSANGFAEEADEFLEQAYQEMMRKFAFIPKNSPFQKTFLDNIILHREIRAQYQARLMAAQ